MATKKHLLLVPNDVNDRSAALAGALLMALCCVVAGAFGVLFTREVGLFAGFALTIPLFLASIHWYGLRMLPGAFVTLSALAVTVFSTHWAIPVALGEHAGLVRVDETLERPEATSFDFADVRVRHDLGGWHNGEKGFAYVYPLVEEGWTRDDPVAVWVVLRHGSGGEPLTGVRAPREERGDHLRAVEDAEREEGLRSAPEPVFVTLEASRGAYLSRHLNPLWMANLVFLAAWLFISYLGYLVSRSRRKREALGPQTLWLGIGVDAYFYLVVTGLFCWVPSIIAVLALLFGRLDAPSWLAVIIPALVVTSLIAPSIVLSRRQPKGASISWDDWGVTERDGEGVRTAIPWSKVHFVRTAARPGEMVPYIGPLYITDGGERRITVVSDATWGGRGCRRRHTAKDTAKLRSLIEVAQARKVGEAEAIDLDDVDPHRPGRKGALTWGAAALGYGGLLAATVSAFDRHPEPHLNVAMLLTVAAVGLTLRALRPLREVLSLRREGKRLSRGAEEVELISHVDTRLVARRASGEELTFETEGLDHPDLGLALRRGRARLILEGGLTQEGRAPYRDDGLTAVAALETAGVTRARRARLKATAVELAARLGFALTTAAAALVHLLDLTP